MNDDFKEAMDDARYRKTSTPKGVSYRTEETPSDTEPDGPPFCVVEYDAAGWVIYTYPARYEDDIYE